MQSESVFIQRTIVKLSRRKASICSQARSNKFCQKTKNTVLPLQKFTIKRSREVAVKAHECLHKLQGTKGSEVDREVQTRFSGSTSSHAAPVETAETKSAPPKEKDSSPTNQLRVQRNYRRVLKFTADKDDFLKKGIDRHGFGQWTAILRDPDLKFQDGRTLNSLKKRAGMKMQLQLDIMFKKQTNVPKLV